MLTSRRNVFLLIRVNPGWRWSLVVPILLPVLQHTIEEAGDWLGLWQVFLGRLKGYNLSLTFLRGLMDFMEALRKLGNCKLVGAKTPEVEVSVDLW